MGARAQRDSSHGQAPGPQAAPGGGRESHRLTPCDRICRDDALAVLTLPPPLWVRSHGRRPGHTRRMVLRGQVEAGEC